MRTTIDIADDVLFAAKDFARRDKKTLGQVISEWGRSALQNPAVAPEPGKGKGKGKAKPAQALNDEDQRFYDLGFRTFPSRAGAEPVTNEHINRIREELGI